MLAQNKYYFIPTINVDGVNFIEKNYYETGEFLPKRTNMNILDKKNCNTTSGGTDLNRNYDFHWGEGTKPNHLECDGDTFRGKAPFSEPET